MKKNTFSSSIQAAMNPLLLSQLNLNLNHQSHWERLAAEDPEVPGVPPSLAAGAPNVSPLLEAKFLIVTHTSCSKRFRCSSTM